MREHGWSQVVERPPAAPLRGLVRRYTGYEEWSASPLRRTEVPSGDVSLIVSLGPRIEVVDPAGRLARLSSFVAPLHDGPATTEFTGAQRGVQIRLAPPAARALLGVPLGELTNTVVTLEDLLGRAAAELVERLNDAPGWEARFALLDGVLARRLADAPRPARAVVGAWARLEATRGAVPVAEIAAELGWSRRHLTARFREDIGLTPKTLARVLRFQRALRALERDVGAGLASIALDCGYYDQAHLNRDFRAFAGAPPSAFLAQRREFPSFQDESAAAA